MRLGQASHCHDKLLGLIAVDRRNQRVAGRKMTVERPDPDTGGSRDLIEAGIRSFFGKGGLRLFEEAKAVALRIGSRLADSSGLAFINGGILRI